VVLQIYDQFKSVFSGKKGNLLEKVYPTISIINGWLCHFYILKNISWVKYTSNLSQFKYTGKILDYAVGENLDVTELNVNGIH
jgi:Ni,Fe-hydrogenase I large subunit